MCERRLSGRRHVGDIQTVAATSVDLLTAVCRTEYVRVAKITQPNDELRARRKHIPTHYFISIFITDFRR